MAYSMGGAVISMSTEGVSDVQGDIVSVGDALRELDASSTSNVRAEFTALAATVAAAAAAYLGMDAVISGVNESIGRLAALDASAQKTGSSIVESLSRLQKVAGMTGTDFAMVDKAVFDFAKTMGAAGKESDQLRAAMGKLGITEKELAGKDSAAQFILVAESLQNYKDSAGKAAIINDIFKKSAENLTPFLNDVAEHVDKFGGRSAASASSAVAFNNNLGLMSERAKEVYDAITEFLLPTLVALTGQLDDSKGPVKTLGDYLQRLTESGKLKQWGEATASAVKFVMSVIVPAAKVAAAYFAIFVAGPAIYAAVAAVITKVIGVVATLAMNIAIGQTATISWNKALFGTSVQADLASGSLSKMKLAGLGLVAAFAGWQIGTLLRENFVEARVAGLVFVGSVLTGWENVKYYALLAWDAINFGWDKSLGSMKVAFAGYVQSVADGLAKVDPTGITSAAVAKYAETLRNAGNAQLALAEKTVQGSAAMKKAHEAELAAIESNILGLIDYELAADAASKTVAKAAGKGNKGDLGGGGGGANADGIKKEMEAYNGLVASIRAKTDENRLALTMEDAVTESQKARIKLDADLVAGKLVLTPIHLAHVRALLDEQEATERLLKTRQGEKNGWDWILQSTASRVESVAALELEVQMYGKSADARELAKIGLTAELDLQKFIAAQRKAGTALGDDTIAQLRAEKDKRVEVATATAAQGKAYGYAQKLAKENKRFAAEAIGDEKKRAAALLEIDAAEWRERIVLAGEGTDAQKALQEEFNTWYANQKNTMVVRVDLTQATQMLDIMAAMDDAAQQAAAGMVEAFGQIGSAVGGLTTTMTGSARAQAAIAAQLQQALQGANGDPLKVAAAQAAAAQQSAQAQVKSYGDMAGAAKNFFKENSAGYKVMEGTEKAFRAAQMVMAVQSMLKQSGLLTAFTGLFVASKATQTAAEATATATSTVLAGSQASAWGITAVIKAIASVPFPGNLVAGAATLAAVIAIGAKMSGGVSGSGGTSAADMQEKQGTGSVFGDSTAKSDSIGNSIEMLKSNSDAMVPINRGMLSALRNIESAMGGLTNILVRTVGITDGSNMGIQTGTIDKTGLSSNIAVKAFDLIMTGGLLGKLTSLWGKTTQNIVDSGLQFGGSVRDLQAGRGYQQYASVDTVKSSFFGLKKTTSNAVQTGDVSPEISSQFGQVFANLEAWMVNAAKGFGSDVVAVTKAFDALSIEKTQISLKGLSGEALTEALNAVISKTMDQISEAVFPNLDEFRQVGEGYAETVVRLASNYATLDSVMASIGTTFGAVGIASLAARERLIGMAGGMDTLVSQTKTFADNFLTEAERMAPVAAYVASELQSLGMSGITTRDQFKAAVLGLTEGGALATEEGARVYAGMLNIAGAFAEVYPAIEETGAVAMSAKDVLSQRSELQKQLNALTMTAAQLEDLRREAIHGSNQALFDSVQVAAKAKAIADERTTLQDELNKLTMTESQLLAQKRETYDESNRALFDELQTARTVLEAVAAAAKAAEEAAMSAARTAVTNAQSEKDAAVKVLGDLTKLEPPLVSMVDSLLDTKNGIADLESGLDKLMGVIEQTPLEKLAGLKDGLADITAYRKNIRDQIEDAELAGMSTAGQVSTLQARETGLWATLDTAADPLAVADKLQATIIQRIRLEAGLRSDAAQFALEQEQEAAAVRRDSVAAQIDALKTMQEQSRDLTFAASKMRFGDLSALNYKDQLAAARALYDANDAKAKGGDMFARGQVQDLSQAYLQELRSYTGSSGEFASEFARVTGNMDAIAAMGLNLDPQIAALQSHLPELEAIKAATGSMSTSIVNTSALEYQALTGLDSKLAELQVRQEARVAEQAELVKEEIASRKRIEANQEAQIRQRAAIADMLSTKLDLATTVLNDLNDRQRRMEKV